MTELSHFNDDGRARMVNVGAKTDTVRTAVAGARVMVSRDTLNLIKDARLAKGDVLGTAQIAGVMGAKQTPNLIPMCHPLLIAGADISFEIKDDDCAVEITATVSCTGQTGVEMEAMTAVSVAALTIYDMCKAVQKDITIENIRLLKKTGGKSGEFVRKEK